MSPASTPSSPALRFGGAFLPPLALGYISVDLQQKVDFTVLIAKKHLPSLASHLITIPGDDCACPRGGTGALSPGWHEWPCDEAPRSRCALRRSGTLDEAA